MNWSTTAGLFAVLLLCAIAAYVWLEHCKTKKWKELQDEIDETTRALDRAIEDQPRNLAEHLRLRYELDRLLGLRGRL